jgi:hypothetical protein
LSASVERPNVSVIGEPETARLIDPAGFHDLRKLHDRLMDVHARNPWSYSNPQV